MSDILAYITANSFKFPLKLALSTVPTLHSQISGYSIKEVKVVKSPNKNLPIAVKFPTKKSPERSVPIKPTKSPKFTPVHSPKALSASKQISPKSNLQHLGLITSPNKKKEPISPKQDIIDILKKTLIQEKKEKKAEKIRKKQKSEEKLTKKKKMKEFDENIRKENLQKFKQKLILSRPKWGLVEKKSEKKTLKRFLLKKKEEKRDSLSFEYFNQGAKLKFQRKNRASELSCEENDENRIKKVRFCIPNIAVEAGLLKKIKKALRILNRVIENNEKKKTFFKFAKNWVFSNLNQPISFSCEDIEVQKIMQGTGFDQKIEEKSEIGMNYEKIFQDQAKLKTKRKVELVNLKSKDLQEMEKLAEVLGDNPEVKKKFQEMIDRRYSKLESLFEENLENIKQALDLESDTIQLKVSENDIPQKASEFSSSFIRQLNSLENDGQESELRKSVENIQEKIEVFIKGKPNSTIISEEDPSQPLISESLMEKQGEESALESMIQEIKTCEVSAGESTGSIDLRNKSLKENNPILILEDSFHSSVSEKDQSFSTIKGMQGPETEFPTFEQSSAGVEKEFKKKSVKNRLIYENFPKFEGVYAEKIELSTETEGYGLIIQRVLFTLERDLFQEIFHEFMQNDEFFAGLALKSVSYSQSVFHDFDKNFETGYKSVISTVQSLQTLKSEKKVKNQLQKIFNPQEILNKIQGNFDDINEEILIFDYSDLNFLEKINTSSFSSNSNSSINKYMEIHNKLIIDALNEAIMKVTKNKIGLPWKIQQQPCLLDYKTIMNESRDKVCKWTQIEAGKIPSVEMINSFGVIDEDKLLAARQDNLAKLLILDNCESDSLWVKCEFEETQTAIDLAENLFSDLMTETIQFIL